MDMESFDMGSKSVLDSESAINMDLELFNMKLDSGVLTPNFLGEEGEWWW